MYDSSPEKDKSLDYLGNKIKTLDEYSEENKRNKQDRRTKKNFYIQKNFQNKCANQKPKDFNYLKDQIEQRKMKEQYMFHRKDIEDIINLAKNSQKVENKS